MKNRIITLMTVVFVSLLFSGNCLADAKTNLVDEIFFAHEEFLDLCKRERKYMYKPRRKNPFAKKIRRAERKIKILVSRYEKEYNEVFYDHWKYEEWLEKNK